MTATGVHPDLQKERDQASFNPNEVTNLLYGGPEKAERRRYIENLALADPVYKHENYSYMSRDEKYTNAVRMNVHLVKKIKELRLTDPLDVQLYKTYSNASVSFGLHDGMFMHSLETMATQEQLSKWLARCKVYNIIGTYAQTEMGHGTFIRGLETTAHYDAKTEEFVMHSPTLTATKWWPGNLGKTVNHAIVMAQLYIGNKNNGIHPFMVQLRSLDDHSSMPGITLGDIGPKFGFNSNDNGFLRFNHVCIPRNNMLMRNAEVTQDGTFRKLRNDKLTYGTMVFVRSLMLKGLAMALAKGCTITTRYSCVRRQTEIRPGYEPEVLYYQTQQYKIFPLLAASFAFWFTSDNIRDIYTDTTGEIERGNLQRLPELHALSSGLKAFISYHMSSGLEVLRMACGGHGYSHASGLPKIFAYTVPTCTLEGENTVLYLQVARYLVKVYATARTGGKLEESVAYLGRKNPGKSLIGNALHLNSLIAAYEHRATRLIAKAAEKVAQLTSSGKDHQTAWNMTSVQLVKAAAAHSELYTVCSFVEKVEWLHAPASVKMVLTKLCQLYAVDGIDRNIGEFMEGGFMTTSQVDLIQEKLLELMAAIRPNAVALVDSFEFHDRVLDSCLGRYDGQVYEALYKFAIESPLNKTDVHESYYQYLRPMIKEAQSKL